MNIPEGWPTEEMIDAGWKAFWNRYCSAGNPRGGLALEEAFQAMLAAAPTPPEQPGVVSVTSEDADNYCRILSLLGMEEEGDPVAEVERLMATPPVQEGNSRSTVPVDLAYLQSIEEDSQQLVRLREAAEEMLRAIKSREIPDAIVENLRKALVNK